MTQTNTKGTKDKVKGQPAEVESKVKEAPAVKTLGVKEVAVLAGISPVALRRLLRKSFGGGQRKQYVWNEGDPAIDQIVIAVKTAQETAAAVPAEKTEEVKPGEEGKVDPEMEALLAE